jgi:hypothetical protein
MQFIRDIIRLIEDAQAPASNAPEIGAEFTYNNRNYAVTGYLTDRNEEGVTTPVLRFCDAARATYVVGQGGGSGAVAPIAGIALTGGVASWTPEQREKAQEIAAKSQTSNVTFKKPKTNNSSTLSR